jgi:hypothetical protein
LDQELYDVEYELDEKEHEKEMLTNDIADLQ